MYDVIYSAANSSMFSLFIVQPVRRFLNSLKRCVSPPTIVMKNLHSVNKLILPGWFYIGTMAVIQLIEL